MRRVSGVLLALIGLGSWVGAFFLEAGWIQIVLFGAGLLALKVGLSWLVR